MSGKLWRCKYGHAMGVVERNGSGIRQLLLFRNAYYSPTPADPTAGPSPQSGVDKPAGIVERELEAEVDVMAVVEGWVADVRCSICGEMRTWVPGQEAMERLLKNALSADKRR